MDIRQWIINQAAKLRKQFPDEDGRHAVVVVAPRHTTLDEGFQGDPLADNRPDFVKKDEIGWERLTDTRRK